MMIRCIAREAVESAVSFDLTILISCANANMPVKRARASLTALRALQQEGQGASNGPISGGKGQGCTSNTGEGDNAVYFLC